MTDWLTDTRTRAATDRILDAVRTLSIDRPVTTLGMAEIAGAAGCSRATLYRYFENRHALYAAFAAREAHALVERVWRKRTFDQILDGILETIAEVRETPHLALWFTPENAGIVAQLSNSPEIIDKLATAFVATLRPDLTDLRAKRLGQWTVRAVVSLLILPAADESEERALLHDFLLPFLQE
ncbi:TetR/AcrR family transcriptional regulator [Nocardia arthritidis]|uniref:TetR family transcriptional regulator n=1 Tax=Nocardia arthritidis TaxID=228602 RepID=A0A6G9Y5B5_9NOCA|nr:TetR/AcrR family transcriptional regulator [Nocardia arthritidis]QIS08290.1 TetR family transcriptional regulator [Nocardia arthritidis]